MTAAQNIKRIIATLPARFSAINKNIRWIIALNIAIALCQFIVYSTINKSLGKEALGVWSLVVAATSIGQISSFGFSNSLVRYLPEMLLKKETDTINKMLGTVNFSNFFFTLPILLLLYFPALEYAAHLLTSQQLLVFRSIIPLSMGGLFINNLFLVYSYLLDAMQLYYLRSVIQISGWILFLLLSLLFIPYYGLTGVAIAFFVQNIFQFFIIIGAVSKKSILLKKYPVLFDKFCFKKVFSFGLKSQYINILVIFFDPLVKFFITKNLGLSSTGNYELSNKIVVQARNLLVNTNQVIIPKIVLHNTNQTADTYFIGIQKKNTVFSVSVGMLLLLFAPVAVELFSNHYDVILMQGIIIINVGWVCNMITSIHYYSCIGLDKMNQLVVYHLLLFITVAALYFFIGNNSVSSAVYFSVPSLALFTGSLYNSYTLSGKIASAFRWVRSGIFLYFIFVSFILLAVHFVHITVMTYLLMPVFCIPYIFWIFRQYRAGKFF